MNDEYLRRHEHEEFAKGVDREQVRQNKRIAINMEHMLVNQTEQSKRLEELENRDGEKWRSISMYVLTAVVGAVLGFALKQVGL